jgi:hypothetical protein
MRLALILMLLSLWLVAACQDEQKELARLFNSIKPDVTVVVSEHPTAAETVEVTMLSNKYPKELLQKQVQELGKILNFEPRGLFVGYVSIQGQDPKFSFLKARFAVTGLVDREANKLRVEPILKAFAGAPEPHTLHGFSIIFEGEQPSTKTVRSYKVNNVLEGVGRYTDFPTGIEYKIRLQSQDPSLIVFPDTYEKKPPPPVVPPPAPRSNTLFWVLFAVAGIALVVLVYFALLRFSRPGRT